MPLVLFLTEILYSEVRRGLQMAPQSLAIAVPQQSLAFAVLFAAQLQSAPPRGGPRMPLEVVRTSCGN